MNHAIYFTLFLDQENLKNASTRFLELPVIGQSLRFLLAMHTNNKENGFKIELKNMVPSLNLAYL